MSFRNLTRSEQREQAFALVFEQIFNQAPVSELIENAVEARDLEVSDYVRETAEGVAAHLEEIDREIERFISARWQKSRIGKAALAILRLAIYEVELNPDVPTSVAINEAVELAKKFASPEDAVFVNGLLGGLARSKDAEAAAPEEGVAE